MKIRPAVLQLFCLLGVMAFSSVALADTVTQFDDTLSASDPTQMGRLSRSGIPSDWSSTKTFPGVLNTGTTYFYKTYEFDSSLFAGGQYVQLDYFDYSATATEFFLTAYANSYDPTNRTLNYLGDAGSSPNYFGTDAVSFQVVLPDAANLVLVLNETIGSGLHALGQPFNIQVENFGDTSFDSPVPPAVTPEPSTFVLLGTGLAGLVGAVRRRVRA
jgi:hypothetical protein